MNLCYCGCGTQIPSYRAYAVGHNRRTVARWAGHDPAAPLGNCAECEITLLGQNAWRKMSIEERRVCGMARHAGRGLCNRCHKAAKRAEGPQYGTRAAMRSREEVLEEWELMRSDGVTDLAVAASRMGMTRAGLEKALERARKAGDPRAVVHRNSDLSGGHHVGTTEGFRLRRAA